MGRTILLLVIVLLACGDDGTAPADVEVATITLSSASATLVPDEELTIEATARTADGTVVSSPIVTWSSDDPDVATVEGGRVRGVAAGTATVRAASGTASADVAVTVEQGGFIGPAGGTITAYGGAVVLTVPAAALSGGTAIRIGPIPAPIPDPIFVRGSGASVTFEGAFAVSATLALSYDPAGRAAGLPESRLGLGTLNGGEWSPIAGSNADASNDVASGEISGPGSYGVIMVPSSTPCMMAEHRQFDFRLGAFTWAGPAALTGEATITAEPDGCAIREELRISAGNRVRAVFFYEPETRLWYYTSIDGGASTRLSGDLEGGRMVLYTAARRARVVWEELDATKHTQAGESSSDGTAWMRLGVGTYTRK